MRNLVDAQLSVIALIVAVAAAPRLAQGADPIDLFADVPKLGEQYTRLATWNLRHINVEGDADDFVPGATEEEDFDILIATFAKGIRDLRLDLIAGVEHQPCANEANRLVEFHGELNIDGTWRVDGSQLQYDQPSAQFGGLQFGLLWNVQKVAIDPSENALLLDQRQSNSLRAPWLVTATGGDLNVDLLVLHLRSGGTWSRWDNGGSRMPLPASGT